MTFNYMYVIPIDPSLKKKLLYEFHSSLMAGHGGIKKTLVALSNLFFWPNMRHDVEIFVRECEAFQQVKTLTTAPSSLLQPLLVLALVWNDVTMDFITHLPLSQGFSIVMVVIDSLMKATHVGALAVSSLREKWLSCPSTSSLSCMVFHLL